jgi:hypothetical protein
MFEKGKSGNPGCRPKALIELQVLARLHTVPATPVLMGAGPVANQKETA